MMNFISVVLTLLIIVVVSRMILKKANPVFTFFAVGLLLLVFLGITRGYTPLGEDTTGSLFIDIFAFVGKQTKSQLGGVGSNLMVVSGYAALMTAIGASSKLATVATKHLKKINKPYIILGGLYVVGIILKTMITSHAGLALLLMATTFPILIELGISKLSAAAAIIAAGSLDWGPGDGAVLFAAENVAGMQVGDYFIQYQIIPAVITIAAVAITMMVYFKYLDSKTDYSHEKISSIDVESTENTPTIYALLPTIPLLLVIGFSAFTSLNMDIFTANVVGIMITLAFEAFRGNKMESLSDSLALVFKTMGASFANIVSLIIAAGVFSNGLIELGGISILAHLLTNLKGAQLIVIIAMSFLTFFAVIILGSGNASWFAFGPLVKDIAPKVGLEPYQIAVPMQNAAGIGRGLSPVAASVIAVAGLAEVEMSDLIKRNIVPLTVGVLVNIAASYVFLVLL